MATSTYLKQVAGALTEARTVETSAGAGDASKIPNLNANGVLDITVTNGIVVSAGAGSAGKLPVLDSTGRIDPSAMPVGVTAEVQSIPTTEALAAGDFVNIYNSTGKKCRKADGSSNNRPAHGFVLAAFASAATAVVYLEGMNTQVSGKTPGAIQFLSPTTPGQCTETAPTTAGQIVQVVGVAVDTTLISFEPESRPITLA